MESNMKKNIKEERIRILVENVVKRVMKRSIRENVSGVEEKGQAIIDNLNKLIKKAQSETKREFCFFDGESWYKLSDGEFDVDRYSLDFRFNEYYENSDEELEFYFYVEFDENGDLILDNYERQVKILKRDLSNAKKELKRTSGDVSSKPIIEKKIKSFMNSYNKLFAGMEYVSMDESGYEYNITDMHTDGINVIYTTTYELGGDSGENREPVSDGREIDEYAFEDLFAALKNDIKRCKMWNKYFDVEKESENEDYAEELLDRINDKLSY